MALLVDVVVGLELGRASAVDGTLGVVIGLEQG